MIALLGDTHLPRGSRRLPERCLDLLRGAELILHTGDFTSLATLRQLERLGPLAAVHGNADDVSLQALLPATRVVEHEGLRIGLVHDGGPGQGRHERLARWFPDCDLVVYGHSHQPEVARRRGAWIVNPARAMAVVREGIPALVTLP